MVLSPKIKMTARKYYLHAKKDAYQIRRPLTKKQRFSKKANPGIFRKRRVGRHCFYNLKMHLRRIIHIHVGRGHAAKRLNSLMSRSRTAKAGILPFDLLEEAPSGKFEASAAGHLLAERREASCLAEVNVERQRMDSRVAVRSVQAVGQHSLKAQGRSVCFSPEPPEVHIISISATEWRGKRRALHDIAQNVEQNTKEWSIERITFYSGRSKQQSSSPSERPKSNWGINESSQVFNADNLHQKKDMNQPKATKSRWSEVLDDEMDFSLPVLPADSVIDEKNVTIEASLGSYNRIPSVETNFMGLAEEEEDFNTTRKGAVDIPKGVSPVESQMPDETGFPSKQPETKMRWADGLEEEMDFSVPPWHAICAPAADSGGTPPVTPLPLPEVHVNNDFRKHSPGGCSPTKKMSPQGRHLPSSCRSRWTDDVAVKQWPVSAITQY